MIRRDALFTPKQKSTPIRKMADKKQSKPAQEKIDDTEYELAWTAVKHIVEKFGKFKKTDAFKRLIIQLKNNKTQLDQKSLDSDKRKNLLEAKFVILRNIEKEIVAQNTSPAQKISQAFREKLVKDIKAFIIERNYFTNQVEDLTKQIALMTDKEQQDILRMERNTNHIKLKHTIKKLESALEALSPETPLVLRSSESETKTSESPDESTLEDSNQSDQESKEEVPPTLFEKEFKFSETGIELDEETELGNGFAIEVKAPFELNSLEGLLKLAQQLDSERRLDPEHQQIQLNFKDASSENEEEKQCLILIIHLYESYQAHAKEFEECNMTTDEKNFKTDCTRSLGHLFFKDPKSLYVPLGFGEFVDSVTNFRSVDMALQTLRREYEELSQKPKVVTSEYSAPNTIPNSIVLAYAKKMEILDIDEDDHELWFNYGARL